MLKPKRSTWTDWLDKAKKATRKDKNGLWAESRLLEKLSEIIVIDAEAEKHRIAKEILNMESKQGATPPDGQLYLPGMEASIYEPQRLVRGNDETICENDDAPYSVKAADSQRSRKHAMEALESSDEKAAEAEFFAIWTQQQLQDGREARELTWGNCIRETGIWKPDDADESSKAAD